LGADKMEIPFIKMEANGNNYLLLLEESMNKNLNVSHLISRMSNKNFGIGSDGALILSNTYRPIPYVEIYNSDGTKAKLCINGLRIVSKYLFETKYKVKETIKIKTDSGIYETTNSDQSIIVKVKTVNEYETESFYFNNKKYELIFLDMGNSHIYIINNGSININYFKNVLGRQLSKRFDANVGLITPNNPTSFSIITYERGSKLTLSCGSSICGGASILFDKELIEKNQWINVETLGGLVECRVNETEIEYKGLVNSICKGTYYL